MGSCAGAIMMSKHIENAHSNVHVKTFAVIDATVNRNGYGRQLESFEIPIELRLPNQKPSVINGVFIRAPRWQLIEPQVKEIAVINHGEFAGEVVAIQQNNLIAVTFHPELTRALHLHEYFVSLCRQYLAD